MIDASNAKVIEQKTDEKTGEVVTIERDAFNLEDTGKELSREPAPEVVKTLEEEVAEIKQAISTAKTFTELQSKVVSK